MLNPAPPPDFDKEHFTPQDSCDFIAAHCGWKPSLSTLNAWRTKSWRGSTKRQGPAFFKYPNGKVMYKKTEIVLWLSTFDPDSETEKGKKNGTEKRPSAGKPRSGK